jgi:toxin-antitoxin system PIN domain toxin
MDSDCVALPDVNVLLALIVADHPMHGLARQWWDLGQPFATAAVTENGFIRLAMNPVVMGGAPIAGKAALAHLASLRSRSRWRYWADETTLTASAAARRGLLGARQVTDLHLLALAIQNRGEVVTLDEGFAAALNRQERRYVRTLNADE